MQKIGRQHFESRLMAVPTESNAYEAICLAIKEKTILSTSNSFLLHKNKSSLDNKETGNGFVVIDYYNAVSIAYQNSTELREYLNHITLCSLLK